MISILIQICDTQSCEVPTFLRNYRWSGCHDLLIHSDVLLLLYTWIGPESKYYRKAFPCCVPTGPAWDVGCPRQANNLVSLQTGVP